MKLKPKLLTLEGNDTVFESRKELAENLTNLVTNVEDGLVLALHADWGDGKTTFCKYWIKNHLEKNEILCIYLDAFQSDYHDDALMVITAEIAKLLKDKAPEEKKKAFVDSAKRILSATVGVGIQAALAAATGGAGNKAIEGAGDALKDLAKNYVDKRLEERARVDLELQEFKKALSSCVESTGKLVFIIDELDRCKPPFAVEVLETIKHFFDVDGMVFLLAMNRNQLVSYVAGEYGIDHPVAESYLKKFVNAEVCLPKRNERTGRSKGDTNDFCERLYDAHNMESLFSFAPKERPQDQQYISRWLSYQQYIPQSIAVFATTYNLSLRDIEDAYRAMIFLYAVTPVADFPPPYLVSFLAIVKTKDNRMFDRLKTETLSYNELNETFPLPPKSDEVIEKMRLCMKYCLASEMDLVDAIYMTQAEQKQACDLLYIKIDNRIRNVIVPELCRRLSFDEKKMY